MRKAIRKIIPLIALFTVLTIAVSARASWASEVKGGSSVAISEDEPFTATSYLGVDALYSLTSNEYSSAELVERFYKNCYGINVSAGGGGPSISSAYRERKNLTDMRLFCLSAPYRRKRRPAQKE